MSFYKVMIRIKISNLINKLEKKTCKKKKKKKKLEAS